MLRQIDDRLWISSTPDFSMIRESGATCILSCVRKGPTDAARLAIPRYRQILIPDGKIVREDLFRQAVRCVEEWIYLNQIVLVHCNAGRNRSCTVAALFLMRNKDMKGSEAIAFVRERRPNAIGNKYFEEWLMRGGLS